MVVVTIGLTVFAGPILDITMRAGVELLKPVNIVMVDVPAEGAGK